MRRPPETVSYFLHALALDLACQKLQLSMRFPAFRIQQKELRDGGFMMMKTRLSIATLLLMVFALGLSMPAPAQNKDEKFSALAYLPSGAGPAMVGAGARVNVDLWVNSYTSDADAKIMAGALVEGGSDGLLKVLEKAKSIGKIRLTGRAGFYDFKLIRSHQTGEGRRIYAVGDRPVGFL